MPQFDVHRTPGRARSATPYLLVIQRERYDETFYRVAVPLVLRSEAKEADRHLNPGFMIEGREVVMDTLQIVTIRVNVLGCAIDNLAQHGTQIVRAIDELIAYGR